MLLTPVLGLLNHVLAGESWARERLAAFPGETVSLSCGPGSWSAVIGEYGLLEERADPDSAATVSIALPRDTPVRLLTDRASVFSAATISGSAELAETLAFVFRNLRWDLEHDLARVTGDVFARRTLQLARSFFAWQRKAVQGVTRAVAEYATEESATLACRQQVERFCAEVDVLRDNLARLDKRVAQLETGCARHCAPAGAAEEPRAPMSSS